VLQYLAPHQLPREKHCILFWEVFQSDTVFMPTKLFSQQLVLDQLKQAQRSQR
jgi:hypothetical protein